ncbi:MAG: DUF333 domain-containing protein [Candidatus Peribacteraceae bacterium]|nr:DUF333 domain-containing protein [Candidatus Peribacteraceae bacterium]
MKKLIVLLAFLPLVGCSVGGVELTKEFVSCESGGELYEPGESVPVGDDCNFCVCSTEGELENCSANTCEGSVGMANPAAVKCSVDGLDYEIREGADGGEYGVCTDSTGKECEAWDYFRGDCELAAGEPATGEEVVDEGEAAVDTEDTEDAAVEDETTGEENSEETAVGESSATEEDAVAEETAETETDESAAEAETATTESET